MQGSLRSPGRLAAGLLLLSAPVLGACGGAVYMPRPSPRIQVVPEGNGLVLVKNGRPYTYGLLGGNVDEAVAGNPAAEAEARSYKNKSVAAFVLSTLGAVGVGVGAGVLVYDESRVTPDNGLLVGSLTSLIGGLTLSLVGSIVAASAQPHLWNAINLYNDGIPSYAWPPPPQAYPGYPGYSGVPGVPLVPMAPLAPAPPVAAPLQPAAPPPAFPVTAPLPPPAPPVTPPPEAPH